MSLPLRDLPILQHSVTCSELPHTAVSMVKRQLAASL